MRSYDRLLSFNISRTSHVFGRTGYVRKMWIYLWIGSLFQAALAQAAPKKRTIKKQSKSPQKIPKWKQGSSHKGLKTTHKISTHKQHNEREMIRHLILLQNLELLRRLELYKNFHLHAKKKPPQAVKITRCSPSSNCPSNRHIKPPKKK